jgi:hypothetical protein
MTFTQDEMILALLSLVRATDPAMLRREADGFTVDFEAIGRKTKPSPDELLLLKMRAVLDATTDDTTRVLELDAGEGSRLAAALAKLEALQTWSPDVLELSRALRARLTTAV